MVILNVESVQWTADLLYQHAAGQHLSSRGLPSVRCHACATQCKTLVQIADVAMSILHIGSAAITAA